MNIGDKLRSMGKYSIDGQFALKTFLSLHGVKWDTMYDKDMLGAINLSVDGEISRQNFEHWQSNMVNSVLLLTGLGFKDMAPQNMFSSYLMMHTLPITGLKKALSRMRDMLYGQKIGTLEEIGWDYIDDTGNVQTHIDEICQIPDQRITFFDVMLLTYWHKITTEETRYD